MSLVLLLAAIASGLAGVAVGLLFTAVFGGFLELIGWLNRRPGGR